ncbi:MAG: flagellar basal body-associated FliL family protein [Deltaproteobacteria bacterium]|nr:flagellar basal body-associated FliL family protein [Deltaproteobacteria bacterium]
MADEENPTEGEEGKKKISKKLLIGGVAGILLLAGIGGGAAMFLMSPSTEPEPKATPEHPEAPAAEAEAPPVDAHAPTPETIVTKEEEAHRPAVDESLVEFGASYVMKPFHLNLGNPLENRYIRLEIALEYKGGQDQLKEIDTRLPQLRDAIISVASRKTREFLLGPDGKDQLRLEMLNRVNQYMTKKIESVYITDMIIE